HTDYLKKVYSNKESKDINAVKSKSMQKQLEQLQLLSEIGKDINTMINIEDIFDAIYDYLDKFFDDYNLLLGVLENKYIHYVYNNSGKTRIKPYRRELDNKNALASWAIKNEKMIVINDLENEFSIYVDNLIVYDDPNIPQSVIVIPLKVNDEIIGVMNFQTLKKDMLSIERVEMFRIIASYAAIAVKNSLYSKELENLSNNDQLTGLYNWRFYDSKLKEILSSDYKTFALFILDIDHFKSINDSFGHSVGNLCLKVLAGLSKRYFSDSEFIARIGGEEFAIGYVNRTRQDVVKMGDEFIKKIEEEMREVEFHKVELTVSLGVAYYANTPNLISDDIFKAADSALYQAKESGRNNAKFVFKD
ncbi:MAG: sensor domain-containing diguanylate cyclase, partial [Clostridia bacterium]